MKLNATKVKNAKSKEKPYKLFDGGGMFLLVNPTGSKLWRLKYRFGGKEKLLAIGKYPDLSLLDAREARDAARKQLAKGVDPSRAKAEERMTCTGLETFKSVALEWHERTRLKWTERHAKTILSRMEMYVFPRLGSIGIKDIGPRDVLEMLRRIESKGAVSTAHRIKQYVGQVYRYAIASGLASYNPAADLTGALAPERKKHFAAITDPSEIGGLMRAIEGYEGHHVTCCALRLAPLVFVRPGELRHAEWSEIDFEAAEWRIPAEKMKMRDPHIVPLSRQAITVLQDLFALTGPSGFVFPSIRSRSRAMSENTVNAALRRLGYTRDQMTGHGFRSMASTRLNEMGWAPDVIERQLAHAERNQVRAAYNHAQYLPERRKMMQAWADYLETVRDNGKVIPIHQEKTG